jgi:hypothetical protein
VIGVLFTYVRIAATIEAAVIIGNRGNVDPGFTAATAGTVELVWADVGERGGVAMIGMLEDEDVFAMRMGSGETECEFVGLAARVEEIANP